MKEPLWEAPTTIDALRVHPLGNSEQRGSRELFALTSEVMSIDLAAPDAILGTLILNVPFSSLIRGFIVTMRDTICAFIWQWCLFFKYGNLETHGYETSDA